VPYDETPFEDAVGDVDVVLDVIGGDVHRRSYRVVKRGGTVVCLVAAPFEDLGAQYGVKVMVPQVLSDPIALTQIVALVADGKLKPCVEHVLSLSDFAKAQQLSETGHARGKTVLTV
jgi:NADPH:quinone reductase-like Zn-dependent oxidoreductase